MSLSDHLDDIMGDVLPSDNVATEALDVKRVTMNTFRNESKTRTNVKLDKDFSRKLNVLYDTIRIKATLEKQEVLDYNMALEAMAGMDDPVTIRAKLTKTPSRINKALIVKELETTTDEIPQEYIERLGEVNSLFEETRETRSVLKTSIEKLISSYAAEMNRLSSNPPLVLVNGENLNLYTSPLVNIVRIDDTELMYDKYSGALVKKFQWLYASDDIASLLQQKKGSSLDVSAEADSDIDLDVTEEEEEIASKLASKIDMTEDTEVVTEDNNSGTVVSSALNEASLESVCGSVYCSLSILVDSVEKLAVSEEQVSSLDSSIRTNLEKHQHNLIDDEVHYVLSQIPNIYKQLTHVLNVSDMLSEQNNPIDQLLELLQFLD